MSNYYLVKIRFFNDIDNIIETNKGSKKVIDLNELEYKYSLKYGFGKLAIIKRFRVHENLGSVIINGDQVTIL